MDIGLYLSCKECDENKKAAFVARSNQIMRSNNKRLYTTSETQQQQQHRRINLMDW